MTTTNNYLPFVIPLASLISGTYWQNIVELNCIILLIPVLLIISTLTNSIIKEVARNILSDSKGRLPKNLSRLIEEEKNKKNHLLIYALFFFSGAFLLQHKKEANDNFFQLVKKQKAKLESFVQTIENDKNNSFNQIIKLKTPYGSLLCYSCIKQELKVGDKIEIENIEINKSQKKNNQTGKPTFSDYLLKENILGIVFFNKKTKIKIINRPKYSIFRWIEQKKTNIYQKLKKKLNKNTFSYFAPIFLGYKKIRHSLEIKKKFNSWGLSHYLARSGLHIIIFILIIGMLLKYIPISMIYKTIILISACLMYHLFTWPSISYYRAIYLFILYQIAKLLNKQTNFLHLFSIITIFILLFNPMQIFFLDFQLSFVLTFSLGWLNLSANNCKKIKKNEKRKYKL